MNAVEAMQKSMTIAKNGSDHINQTTQIMIKINSAIDNVTQINDAIALATKEQNKVIGDINININQISSFTSDTASVSNELLTINNSLNLQANKLNTTVSGF